nr:MAG TPA: hypothetical protein [Caudoviricetes sp.]
MLSSIPIRALFSVEKSALFAVARLLQILQQVSRQRPAGLTGGVTKGLHLRQGPILNVSASKALLLRGHIQIAGQQGTGMGAKV